MKTPKLFSVILLICTLLNLVPFAMIHAAESGYALYVANAVDAMPAINSALGDKSLKLVVKPNEGQYVTPEEK